MSKAEQTRVIQEAYSSLFGKHSIPAPKPACGICIVAITALGLRLNETEQRQFCRVGHSKRSK